MRGAAASRGEPSSRGSADVSMPKKLQLGGAKHVHVAGNGVAEHPKATNGTLTHCDGAEVGSRDGAKLA